jgi:hypothetical protein
MGGDDEQAWGEHEVHHRGRGDLLRAAAGSVTVGASYRTSTARASYPVIFEAKKYPVAIGTAKGRVHGMYLVKSRMG